MFAKCAHCGWEFSGVPAMSYHCAQCGEVGCAECMAVIRVTTNAVSVTRYAHLGECAESYEIVAALRAVHLTVHTEPGNNLPGAATVWVAQAWRDGKNIAEGRGFDEAEARRDCARKWSKHDRKEANNRR